MCITTTSRFTVSIILVVITTLKERRVAIVAVMLLESNVTSVGTLVRHWIESATKVLVVTPTFALMARQKTVGSQAVTCRHFCLGLKWSKIVTDMSTSYVSSRPKEGVKESPRPIDIYTYR